MQATLATIAHSPGESGILPDGRMFIVADHQNDPRFYVQVLTFMDGTKVERFSPHTVVTLH